MGTYEELSTMHLYTPKRNLQDCMEYFEMLFDFIHTGIIIAEPDGTIVYYNKAQEDIDMLPASDVIGKTMWEVFDYTRESSPAMNVARTGKSLFDSVNSYRTRRGNLVNASCTIYPLSFRGHEIIGVICFSQSYMVLDTHLQNVLRDISPARSVSPITNKDNSELEHYSFSSIVGSNEKLMDAINLAHVAAKNSMSTMLVGETGVGKEIFAQSIHYSGPRRKHTYMAINCSAVPETLLEGLLFGTSKGAFTGALNKPGLFEASNNGTIFLDEIDSMPVGLQSKLLRALQEKRIRRVGDSQERRIDVRIISAVGRPPGKLIEQELLRPDFYYRLGVIQIVIPPLRERKDDIPQLVRHFLRKHSFQLGRLEPTLSDAAMQALYLHDWPGNVRELEHALEAAMSIMGLDTVLDEKHLVKARPEILSGRTAKPATPRAAAPVAVSALPPENENKETQVTGKLAEARNSTERNIIESALRTAAGNRSLAAKLLGISPQLLYYKVKKHGLCPEEYTPKSI